MEGKGVYQEFLQLCKSWISSVLSLLKRFQLTKDFPKVFHLYGHSNSLGILSVNNPNSEEPFWVQTLTPNRRFQVSYSISTRCLSPKCRQRSQAAAVAVVVVCEHQEGTLRYRKKFYLTYCVAFEQNVHQPSVGRAMPPLAPEVFPLGVGYFASSSFSIPMTKDSPCLSL